MELKLDYASYQAIQVAILSIILVLTTAAVLAGSTISTFAAAGLCVSTPLVYDASTSFFLVGAYFGQLVLQLFRIAIDTYGFGVDRPSQASEARSIAQVVTGPGYVMTIITLIQFLCNLALYVYPDTLACQDVLGVKTSPYLWIEWVSSVHTIFYLILNVDQNRHTIFHTPPTPPPPLTTPPTNTPPLTNTTVELSIQFLAFAAIFLLFLTNWPLPSALGGALFVLANVSMGGAVMWLQYYVYDAYSRAKGRMINAQDVLELYSFVNDVRIAEVQLNASTSVGVLLVFFPLVYYVRLMGMLSDEQYHLVVAVLSMITKGTFSNQIGNGLALLHDPTKALLLKQVQQSALERSAFLRYVFHEVRVPLNSISLGIQILKDREFKEASTCMADVLEDVLAWQQILDGDVLLAEEQVCLAEMLQAVVELPLIEAKKLHVFTNIRSDVPPYVLGDRVVLTRVIGKSVEVRVTMNTFKDGQ
eukprot:gene24405-29502_t